MDALTAIRGKRDTRAYSDDPIPEDVLSRVLDAARMAGSAKNLQPIRLVVVTDHDDKVRLKDSGDFASWIDDAPVVVVGVADVEASLRVQFDLGRHLQNLMVAGHAEGLASCPVTIHRPGVASELLGIPDDVQPLMIVTLGWPAPGGEAPARIANPRVPLDEYVRWGRWHR